MTNPKTKTASPAPETRNFYGIGWECIVVEGRLILSIDVEDRRA